MMEYKKWEKGKLRPDGKPGFDTPTGKFEIWSTVLEDQGYEPLPKYTEPREGPIGSPTLFKEFSLVFNSGARPHTDFRSQHHGISGLAKDNPEPKVEINIEDAQKRGIKSGDLVEVRTIRGSVKFRAHVTKNLVKGAIEANMGGGTPVGTKAWQESNVNELTDLENYDEISGFPVYKSLLCEVRKVSDGAGSTIKDESHSDKKEVWFKQQKKAYRRIYLDNNATSDIAREVYAAMKPYLEIEFGNPSAIHSSGRIAHDAMDNARRQVARLLNTHPRRIIFTGGGSEADNQALKGVAFAHRKRGNHIITSAIEHPAILQTCQFLTRNGFDISYLDVDKDGMIQPETLKKAITDQTILVSIMLANNEVGTIQPVKQLCRIVHDKNLFFHTDAVQTAGKIEIDVADLDIDLLTVSGHKFHGPKGTGALYIKKGVMLEPLIHGGKQETGLRAGTENIAGIVGMGRAAELALTHLGSPSIAISKLRDELMNGIKKLIPEAVLNGHPESRLPNTLNMTLPGLRGESLVIALDQHGIALSSGSACKSGSPDPTHVLLAMGRSKEEAHCSVRLSLSNYTTKKDIKETLIALKEVLVELETTVRFLPCK
jgi:cysteine desulfurase NifS